MPKCNDKSNSWIGLRFIHEGCGMSSPVTPCTISPRFGIGDKANVAIIEVIPVLPAAADRWGTRGSLWVGKIETSFVIIQIVQGLVFPFMVAPGWHIGCAA